MLVFGDSSIHLEQPCEQRSSKGYEKRLQWTDSIKSSFYSSRVYLAHKNVISE